MQQAAGRLDYNPVRRHRFHQRLQRLQLAVQVRPPDGAAIDQTRAQQLACGKPELANRLQIAPFVMHEIQTDAVNRKRRDGLVVIDRFEVRLQKQLDARRFLRQLVINACDALNFFFGQRSGKNRFVDLHPFGAFRRQFLQNLSVQRKQLVNPAV
ncbi:hypothetical protein HMSSN036_39430 [Paenibacillus macerans]|nr:hypothetical protein HMSSN036_39430 [Paenibacillus macerans]